MLKSSVWWVRLERNFQQQQSYEQLQLKDAHERKLLFTPYLPTCEPDIVPGQEQLCFIW